MASQGGQRALKSQVLLQLCPCIDLGISQPVQLPTLHVSDRTCTVSLCMWIHALSQACPKDALAWNMYRYVLICGLKFLTDF